MLFLDAVELVGFGGGLRDEEVFIISVEGMLKL